MAEQSYEEFLYYIIFSAVFGLFLTYMMFFSSLTIGFIVSKIVSTFLLPKDTFLRISSFQISLLSGTILFRGLKFATKNTCLRVVEGNITIRYWCKTVRQSLDVNESSPSRLSVHLEGVEYLIFNNSYKYDHIAEIIKKRTEELNNNNNGNNNGSNIHINVNNNNNKNGKNEGDRDQGASIDPSTIYTHQPQQPQQQQQDNGIKIGLEDLNLPQVKDFVIPRFYRAFEASSLSIRKGCVMVSNPDLPTILVVLFDKGTGLYTTEKARVPELDYYRQITTMDLINCKVKLKPNKDYNGEMELYVERPQKEDFVSYAFESFKSVFKDFRFTFINTDDSYNETSDLPRRKKEESRFGDTMVLDYGKKTKIMAASFVQIKYYCDIAGPVPANDTVFKEFSAPQWGADMRLSSSTIFYGPWADRNRALLQKFFFPQDYETPSVYRPLAGEQRQYATFQVNIEFVNTCTFSIPFRELSKDARLTREEMMLRKPGYIDIKMDDTSRIAVTTPMVIHNTRGSKSIIDIQLKTCTITTSVTNTTLLKADRFNMACDILYPLVWNQTTEWHTTFDIQKPSIFLLSDHITLFKDLGQDWSAGEPTDITMFVPKIFKFDFILSNFKLYCNVNEQNIINIPNNLEENAHYVFTGPFLKSDLVLPYTSFQSPKTEINFNVKITELSLKLILPLYNTIRQHLEDIEMEYLESLEAPYFSDNASSASFNSFDTNDIKSGGSGRRSKHIKGSSQFIMCEEFSLNGKYLYHQKVDASYLDSVVLNIHGKSPKVKLFGFYVRYFLFLKSNFFGYTSHISNLEKYKQKMEKEKQKTTNKSKKGEKKSVNNNNTSNNNGDDEIQEHNDENEEEEDEEEEEEKNISNGLEIYVSLMLEDATVYCPLGLYSSKQQATIALHEFLLEIRYLPTYLDMYADFSPLVINVPTFGEDEEDRTMEVLDRYIQINDFTFKMHFLYGPKPTETNYADFVNLHIGVISGHVLVSQITSLATWFENFVFHLVNKDNALSTKLASKLDPVYSITKLKVDTVSLYLYSRENITEIRFNRGLSVHLSSVIDQLSHNKASIDIPEVSFKHLVPCNSSGSGYGNHHHHHHSSNHRHHRNKKWAEVGELKISTNLSVYNKEPNWKSDSIAQREFLKLHDSENKLLTFLWPGEGEEEDEDDFIIPSIFNNIFNSAGATTKQNINIGNNNNSSGTIAEIIEKRKASQLPIFNILSPSMYISNPLQQTTTTTTTTTTSGSTSHLSPSHTSTLNQPPTTPTGSNNSFQKLMSTPKTSSFLYPIGSSNHILKWNSNTNSSNSLSQYEFFNQIKQSKSNLDISGSINQSHDYGDNPPTTTNNDDGSSMTDSDFQTPESSLRDSQDGGGGNNKDNNSDIDGDVADFEEDDEDDKLYQTSVTIPLLNQSTTTTTTTSTTTTNIYNNNNNLLKSSVSNQSGFGSRNPFRRSINSPVTILEENEEEQQDLEQQQQQQLQQSSTTTKSTINPQINSLRNHLRTYFFNISQARMDAFGSTSRASSFVECSASSKRFIKQSYSFGSKTTSDGTHNVHGSIHYHQQEAQASSYINYVSNVLHCLPPIPKRLKNNKLVIYKSQQQSNKDTPLNDLELYKVDEKEEDDYECNDKHHKEHGHHTATTTIFIDSMRDIELFASPIILTILEELVESFIARDPSIDYMLDNFQLRTISEQFKVKKFLHNRVRMTLSMHRFNLHWIQSLPLLSEYGRDENVYITELELDSIQFNLSMCNKQSLDTQSPQRQLSPSDLEIIGTNIPFLPQEEFCSFETSLSIKSIHSCIRTEQNQPTNNNNNQQANNQQNNQNNDYIPFELISKYHSQQNHQNHQNQRVIVSFGTDNIMIQGKFTSEKYTVAGDTNNGINSSTSNTNILPNGAFTASLGEIDIFLTTNSPAVIFKIVDTWIFNISKLTSVFGRYQSLWDRQLQTLIGELMRSKTKSSQQMLVSSSTVIRSATMFIHQHHHQSGHMFLPPDFKEIIGDEALIHRLGWKDISRMREFMRDAERPSLDEIINDVTLEQPHDSYQTFQELINEIYEIDEGGDLINLFQSPLIKKVFIQPPGKNKQFDFNIQFEFAGIIAAVINQIQPTSSSSSLNPQQQPNMGFKSNNQLSIGKILGGGVANYIYESNSIEHKGSKSSIDFNFLCNCQKVGLKISPDLITFAQNTVDEVMATNYDVLQGEEVILGSHEWKEAVKPSSQTPTKIHHQQSQSFDHNIGDLSPISTSPNLTPIKSSGDSSPQIQHAVNNTSKHKSTSSSPNLSNRNSLLSSPYRNQPINTSSPPQQGNSSSGNNNNNNNLNTKENSIENSPKTIEKKKKKVIHLANTNKSIFTITVHGHFSFKEINLRAITAGNRKGMMRMILKDLSFIFNEFGKHDGKKKESRPNGEYIHMIHSCIFSIPDVQLQLLDQIDHDQGPVRTSATSTTSSKYNLNYEKPIIELNLKSLQFNEVLFKVGKKKTRTVPGGRREEYIEYTFKYDIMMTFEKADLPFKMSHRFLPKLKDFLKEWTPVDSSSSSTTKDKDNKDNKDKKKQSNSSNQLIKNLKFPPIRIKLDLKEIFISTDAISSLPVTYHISRITTSMGQISSNEAEFNVQLHQHEIKFSSKALNTSEPFMLPRIKAFGLVHKQSSGGQFLNVAANLEIGFIQNVLSIALLENILVLRTTLSKEIDDLFNAYIHYAEKDGPSSNQKPHQHPGLESPSLLSQIKYNLSLVLRGFEILMVNDSASLLLSTGVIDVRVSNCQNAEMGNQIVSNDNEFNWKVGLRGFSLILSDPTFTLDKKRNQEDGLQGYHRIQTLKTQVWAGVITDISLQSFPYSLMASSQSMGNLSSLSNNSGGSGKDPSSPQDINNNNNNNSNNSGIHRPRSILNSPSISSNALVKTPQKTSPLEKAWVVISKTVITLQPWAIDKATNLWIFYYNAYQKTISKLAKIPSSTKQVKRALNTMDFSSSLPIKQTNLSLNIKIEDTSVCVPINDQPTDVNNNSSTQPSRKNDNKDKLTCSALVVSLGYFTLDGIAIRPKLPALPLISSISKTSKPATTSTREGEKEKEQPIKVLGDCKFSKFSFQFVDNYHPSSLDKIHTLRAVNRGVIDSGDCQIVTKFSSHLVQCFVQVKTSGLFLHLDTKLLYYIVAFQDLILLGQEKIKSIQDTQSNDNNNINNSNNNNIGIRSNSPTKLTSEKKSSSFTNTSSTTAPPTHRLEIDFLLKTTVGEARLTKHVSHEEDNSDMSHDDSPSLDSSFDKTEKSNYRFKNYMECFPLPPLSFSTNHIFIPSNEKMKGEEQRSETNIMLIMNSQEIKLTPLFTHFIYDLVHNAPTSKYADQFNQQHKKDETTQSSSSSSNSIIDYSSTTGSGVVKTTPGSVTFTIRINPSKVLLDGVDHIFAIVEIGAIDIFMSSIIKDTSSSRRVLLMNGTISSHNIIFRIMNSNSSEERLGVLLRSIQVNIGTCHGITDKGPVISVLVNSDSSHGFVNSKYIDEVLIFFNVWVPTKNNVDDPLPVVEKNQIQHQTKISTESPQIYVTIKIGSIGLDVDFLPISRFNMLVSNICAVHSPNEEDNNTSSSSSSSGSEGNNNNNRKENKFYLTKVSTGSISILCHGNLEGNLELDGIELVGERKPYKTTREINIWTGHLSPIRTSFDFNQSEILDLRSGDIQAKFFDPPSESTKGNMLHQRSMNFELSCSTLQIQLSCETITSVVEIIKRINETITDKVASSKHYLKSRGYYNNNNNQSNQKKKIFIESLDDVSGNSSPVVIGSVKVKGNNFNLLLFGYSLKDPTWIQFSLESYQVALDQSRKKEETHRQLSILLGANTISKMTDESAHNKPSWSVREPFNRPLTGETKIVKIPVSSLIMYTTEFYNQSVEFYYLTEFTDSIAISVNLNLYNDIREIVQTYIKAATDLSPPTTSPLSTHHIPTSNTTSLGNNTTNLTHSLDQRTINTPSDSLSSTPLTHSGTNRKNTNSPMSTSLSSNNSSIYNINNNNNNNQNNNNYNKNKDSRKRLFLEKKFQLSPTLNVLGDFTPKITTVFGWLGIKDINHTIPYFTHIGLTDNLETLLSILNSFSNQLNKNSSDNISISSPPQHHQQHQDLNKTNKKKP